MSDASQIEWTDATWQVTAGCSRVSDGCTNCYAIREAHRMERNPHEQVARKYRELTRYVGDGPDRRLDWKGNVRLLHDHLTEPLRWREPRRIFVDSLSDLFHPSVPQAYIFRVLDVIAKADWHTFQVLTKRPASACSVLASYYIERGGRREPLPNLWLGVSVEDQAAAETRIPHLVSAAAAVKWLSCEPLLGPLNLSRWIERLHWVVAGGESGPHARPMHADWARALRGQCALAGVPFLFKQWGNWLPEMQKTENGYRPLLIGTRHQWPDGTHSVRLRKSSAGRSLDGELHDSYPAPREAVTA